MRTVAGIPILLLPFPTRQPQTRGDSSIVFFLASEAPVVLDASSGVRWPIAGKGRAHVQKGGANGYLEISFADCRKMGEWDLIAT